jgi:hypothetical protein
MLACRVPRELEKKVRSWVRFQFQEELAENKVIIIYTVAIVLKYHGFRYPDVVNRAAEERSALGPNPSRRYPTCTCQ